MRIFDRRYETMPRPELAQLQLERLQALVARLRRNVRRYRDQLAHAKVASLDDLGTLPLTAPEDVLDSFPYGMFALPLREVIRLHTAAGPGGKPIVIGHTRNDLAHWGRLVARQWVASGVTANDVIQISLGRSNYTGAAGYLLGAEVIEASVIDEEPYHVDYQLAMLRSYRPTVLLTTPTNALELMRLLDQRKIDPQSLHLRTVLLSRPVSAALREDLGAGLLTAVQCVFGVGEILDPGLCVECEAGQFHANEDQFLAEVVDGELLVTTLCREALPLLRYRTRTQCELVREKCRCGRTGAVLRPGQRLDQRLRVGETALYERQISEVLAQTRVGDQPHKVEVQDERIIISLTVTNSLFSDMIWSLEKLRQEIESEFLTRLGVIAEVRFMGPSR